MLVAGVIRIYIGYYLNAYYSKPLLNYPITEQIKDVFPSLRIALTMAVPVYLMSFIPISYYILLPLQLIVGVAIVLFLCEKKKLPEYCELKEIAVSYLKIILHKEQQN